MKLIHNNKILKIRAVDNLDKVEINKYKENVWTAKIENEYYMIIKRKFNNKSIEGTNVVDLENATCKFLPLEDCLNLNVEYGSNDSIIVDMNGIDNFIFAKAQVFNDYVIRKILLKMNLLSKSKQYLRFGCSGARECDFHPGGEVYESCLINGKDGSGISQSISGYLPKGREYSVSTSLYDRNKDFLREERIVYSHTAFLDDCGINDSKSMYIKIKPKKENVSFLDIVDELKTKLGLSSFAIQVYIRNSNNENNVKINGRVLRNMPQKAFKVLQEATDIGLEQLFELEGSDIMYGVGTHYKRYEPEWKEFTGGRQYERRGHIHAAVISNNKNLTNKHEVFHLRDVFINPSSNVQIVINPIEDIYKIYQIYKIKDNFYCKSTDKSVDEVIKNINNIN